jgi:hypothetical protein
VFCRIIRRPSQVSVNAGLRYMAGGARGDGPRISRLGAYLRGPEQPRFGAADGPSSKKREGRTMPPPDAIFPYSHSKLGIVRDYRPAA